MNDLQNLDKYVLNVCNVHQSAIKLRFLNTHMHAWSIFNGIFLINEGKRLESRIKH